MNEFNKNSDDKKNAEFPGYPLYPASEDIYNKEQVNPDIDPEDTSKKKTENELPEKPNEKSFKDDVSGGDLDVPDPEADEYEELPGNEDEENSYYSLGGDSDEPWEENNGD